MDPLVVPLGNKRELVFVRHRTRMIARLVGLDPFDQTLLAARVFDLAFQQRQQSGPVDLCFEIKGEQLQIYFREKTADSEATRPFSTPPDPLIVLLPGKPNFSVEDMTWMIAELDRLCPFSIFAEVQKQNQEMLELLGGLRSLEKSPPPREKPFQEPAA